MQQFSLYRKYRPSSFDQLVGQDAAISILKGALKNGVAHAYLFVGPRGTGKTSLARIFAAELGTNAGDLYELDAATNTGIEDVREMKEWVATAPFKSPYKVYIFDEVHMFSKSAFNGLLKVLEEPPLHVIFVLATTEIHKVPETVVSRCQRIDFARPTESILVKVITATARSEGYSISDDASTAIALLAGGSFRDAHGALQKVLHAVDGSNISLADVEHLAGAPSKELALRYLIALITGNIEQGIEAVASASKQNADMQAFLEIVMRSLRAWMLRKYSPSAFARISGDSERADLDIIEASVATKKIFKPSDLLRDLIMARERVTYASIPELPLELLLIDHPETQLQ
ncbi:MAG: DNA polymerase III subunit gamma/tau [Candidatus Vogelbacteria bacterium]|nr:DNA polymerase III subunit gamma/tau [Candidatus Vogelbacteria bacterium]